MLHGMAKNRARVENGPIYGAYRSPAIPPAPTTAIHKYSDLNSVLNGNVRPYRDQTRAVTGCIDRNNLLRKLLLVSLLQAFSYMSILLMILMIAESLGWADRGEYDYKQTLSLHAISAQLLLTGEYTHR